MPVRHKNPWLRAGLAALALHLMLAGAFSAHIWLSPAATEDYGVQDAIEFAPLIASAETEHRPDAAEADTEDRQAMPETAEALSQKQDRELPTEQASPTEADPDLRMTMERTQKESDKPFEQQQATEAMKSQQAQTSSQASTAAESAPDQSGDAHDRASAPDVGAALEAKRRMEQWQKKLFAHIVKFKRYPLSARGRRLAGEAQVSFSLDAGGEVLALKLVRASGHHELDTAALDWIMRASPMPAPPPAAIRREFALPMKFTAP